MRPALHLEKEAGNSVRALPKGSYVVLFWVCYGFLVREYNILPKKELHRRVWVGCRVQGAGFQDFGLWRVVGFKGLLCTA